MTTQLQILHRDLNKFFVKGRHPARQYGFRVGANGTPAHEAKLHGPFDSKAAAQAAADAFNAAAPADHDAPYAWAVEPWQ